MQAIKDFCWVTDKRQFICRSMAHDGKLVEILRTYLNGRICSSTNPANNTDISSNSEKATGFNEIVAELWETEMWNPLIQRVLQSCH